MAGRPVRVVLADDNVLLREGIAGLLERAGFDIAGQAGDADGLIALVRTERPDLAVVDIRMPPDHSTEGLGAALAIRREFPDTGIMVLSAFVHTEHAVELLASGQRIGYLLKACRLTCRAEAGELCASCGAVSGVSPGVSAASA